MEITPLKIFPWDRGEAPYFKNEEGYEWYVDRDITRYAREADALGRKMKEEVTIFFIKKGEYVTRAIVDNKQNILGESQRLEDIVVKIDWLKLTGVV